MKKLEIGDEVKLRDGTSGIVTMWHRSKRSFILDLPDGTLSDWIPTHQIASNVIIEAIAEPSIKKDDSAMWDEEPDDWD